MVYGYVCEYHKMCTYIIYHIYIYTIVTICGFPICISVLNMYIIFIHCICISTEHKWWRLPLGPQHRSSTSLRGLNHGDSWTEKRGRGIVKWDRKNDIDIDSYPPKKKEKVKLTAIQVGFYAFRFYWPLLFVSISYVYCFISLFFDYTALHAFWDKISYPHMGTYMTTIYGCVGNMCKKKNDCNKYGINSPIFLLPKPPLLYARHRWP
jgi:hypothetical protein